MKNFRNIMIIFIVLTAAVLMTGCTEDEVAMLNLINESQSLTQYRVDGVWGGISHDSSYNQNDDIQYTYEINKDAPGGEYMHIQISGTAASIALQEPLEFYSYGDRFYVSKNLLRYLNEARRLYSGKDMTYLLDELDATVLKDTDFLVCESGDDPIAFVSILMDKFNINTSLMTFMTFNMGTVKNFSRDLINEADYNNSHISFLTDAFDGFDSETVTKIDGGYQLAFGVARLFDTMTNFAEFTYAHRDEIYAKEVYYTNLFYDSIPCPDEETRSKVETLRSADIPRESMFNRKIGYLYNTYRYGGELFDYKDELMQLYGGSYFSYSITKNNSFYNSIERYLLSTSDNANYLENTEYYTEYYNEQTITPANIEVKFPQRTMQYSEYSLDAETVKNRINPCVALEIETEIVSDNSYTKQIFVNDSVGSIIYTCRHPKYKLILKNGDIEYMDMTKSDNNIYIEGRYITEYGYSIFSDDSGSLYLPLRNYAKALGEEVVWDESTETAAVRRGDEIIPIDGFLLRPGYADSDLYFCRIREFEKLGYTIEYSETESEYSDVWKNAAITIKRPLTEVLQ